MRATAYVPRHTTGPHPLAAGTGRDGTCSVSLTANPERPSVHQLHSVPIKATNGSMSSKLT